MKYFIMVLVLLVLVVGVAAWYAEWLRFSTATDEREVQVAVSVNKERVREDAAAAQKKVEALREHIEKRVAPSSEREAFQQQAERTLAGFEQRLEEMKTRAEAMEAAARTRLEARIQQLSIQLAEARSKYDQLKAAGEDTWEKHKADLSAALDDLKKAFEPDEADQSPN